MGEFHKEILGEIFFEIKLEKLELNMLVLLLMKLVDFAGVRAVLSVSY